MFEPLHNERLQSLCIVRGKRLQLRRWATPKVNAAYIWWANSILLSDGLLECPQDEIIAAIMHELGHVTYRHARTMSAIPLTGVLVLVSSAATMFHYLPVIACLLLFPVIFVLVTMAMDRISRSIMLRCELQADNFAVDVLGGDASLNAVLARASSKRRPINADSAEFGC